ncbi:P1 family peptidase [Hyphobacterium marinum]|uniref:P1 family peptidase n=1 Tax=Hyphobacterium marinum TaxID=3116574 RepID=A0ABU7LWE0_9PROT|nr:P1 family peptidase [Hyphobacterium sp. Y6023]MEE2565839.1 P1 family peptidase [Hyphobacterium sp. Y6023]
MAAPGRTNSLLDVDGIAVGQAHDATVRTGVTVILPETRAVCSADVRGGGPGTRETDALQPHTLVDAVDAVVLSGGSSWGLGAADAVAAALGARGRGFSMQNKPGVPVSPVVPSAILYDLTNGGAKDWGEAPPYARLGREALDACGEPLSLGRAGAGYGALAGSLPGGIGSASIVTADGYTVAAIVAVNSVGSVRIPGREAYWAHALEIGGEFGGYRPEGGAFDAEDWGDAKLNPNPGENTTVALVATDAVLTSADAKRLAIMAQTGLVRAIRPVHTPFDGDTVFAMSTGKKPLADPAPLTLTRLGSLAADCLARAIARGVHEAACSEV